MAGEAELVTAAQTVGFPIVAFMLMYKLATDTIKENTGAINELNRAVVRLCDKEDDKGI